MPGQYPSEMASISPAARSAAVKSPARSREFKFPGEKSAGFSEFVQRKNRQRRIVNSANIPSRQVIFFPSSYERPAYEMGTS
jgi:hypothetical protein